MPYRRQFPFLPFFQSDSGFFYISCTFYIFDLFTTVFSPSTHTFRQAHSHFFHPEEALPPPPALQAGYGSRPVHTAMRSRSSLPRKDSFRIRLQALVRIRCKMQFCKARFFRSDSQDILIVKLPHTAECVMVKGYHIFTGARHFLLVNSSVRL